MRRCSVLVVLAACGDNAPASTGTQLVALPAVNTDKLDLLFVIGNEVSTIDHQVALWSALPALFDQISIDGRPDLQIAAITPDLGTTAANGVPAPAIPGSVGGCAQAGDDGAMFGWSASSHLIIDSATDSNHPNALLDDVRFAFERGSNGCAFQQPLAAVRRAFENAANAEFRRPDAALGIVVLADEDDCSALDPALFTTDTTTLGPLRSFRCTQFGVRCAEPDMTSIGPRTSCEPDHRSTVVEDPANFVAAFRSQVSEPRRLAFGTVTAAAKLEIVKSVFGSMTVPAIGAACTWPDAQNVLEVAAPAVRLDWLASQLNGTTTSICGEDLTQSTTALGIAMRRAMGDPCVEDDVPLDHCTAVDELDGVETPLLPCGTGDCWELVTDPATCPNAAHQKLVVHRKVPVTAGNYTLVRC